METLKTNSSTLHAQCSLIPRCQVVTNASLQQMLDEIKLGMILICCWLGCLSTGYSPSSPWPRELLPQSWASWEGKHVQQQMLYHHFRIQPLPLHPLFFSLPLNLLPFSPPLLSSLTFPLSSCLSCPPSFPLQQGKVEAALSDYAKVCELDPGNTEALRRQAMHKFEQGCVHAWPYICSFTVWLCSHAH